jgi:hypothetical protein
MPWRNTEDFFLIEKNNFVVKTDLSNSVYHTDVSNLGEVIMTAFPCNG